MIYYHYMSSGTIYKDGIHDIQLVGRREDGGTVGARYPSDSSHFRSSNWESLL